MQNENLSRKATELIIKLFNRKEYELERYQVKATNSITKNIIEALPKLDLNKDDIKLVKTETFKDTLFNLLQENLSLKDLKALSTPKTTKQNYIDAIAIINANILASLVGESNPEYGKLGYIFTEYYTFLENLIDNNLNN